MPEFNHAHKYSTAARCFNQLRAYCRARITFDYALHVIYVLVGKLAK